MKTQVTPFVLEAPALLAEAYGTIQTDQLDEARESAITTLTDDLDRGMSINAVGRHEDTQVYLRELSRVAGLGVVDFVRTNIPEADHILTLGLPDLRGITQSCMWAVESLETDKRTVVYHVLGFEDFNPASIHVHRKQKPGLLPRIIDARLNKVHSPEDIAETALYLVRPILARQLHTERSMLRVRQTI